VRCCTNNQHQTNSSRLVRSNYSRMGIRPFLHCLCASWKYKFREKEQERVVRSPVKTRCGCIPAPTTSIKRTLHVSFALIIQAWAFVLFYIAFVHLESTSSVKKSKKESWGVLSDASCGCAAAPTTSIKRTLHVSFALIIQEWAFVLWETNEILHCYWEDRIPQTASRERTWVDDHNFLASLNQNVVRASLAADVCSSAVTWYTMNATA
jgi:hypothetical protein